MTDKSINPSSKVEQCDRSHPEPCLEGSRHGNRSKARTLAQVYAEILNWPATDPQNQSATTDLGGELVADSESETPEGVSMSILSQSAQQTLQCNTPQVGGVR